ncbi:MAG: hypothetical protein RMK29_15235 [Myxococcales bacterium]|nr:hypothetical protein [Myxococcota bacterium]MDW8283069.1 hypothetical protein [Myxococcales bacterium]
MAYASAPRRHGPVDRGLSLVEVLVALGLSAGIALGALTMAQVLFQTHRDQEQIHTLSENLRGALAQMMADIRLAGAGLSSGVAHNAAGGPVTHIPAVRVINSSTGPDQLELLTVPGSAVVTVLAPVQANSVQLLVDSRGSAALQSGDYLLLSDYTHAVLYRAQSITDTVLGGIPAVGVGVSPAPSFPVTQFPAGSLVMRAAVVRYSIGPGTAVGMPETSLLLVEDGAPLGTTTQTGAVAEHIYDMQIAVGIDGIGGHAADGNLTEVGLMAGDDEWVFNVPGESLPPAPFVLRALRVVLVGRTPLEGSQLGPGRPAAEDHPAGAPDRFRWRVQREVIMIRNMVLR